MKRFVLFFLLVFALLLSPGCGIKPAGESGTTAERTDTDSPSSAAVYLGESLPFPEGYSLNASVRPLVLGESGSVLCLASAERDGGEEADPEYRFVTFDAETVSEDLPVPVPEGETVVGGVIGDDCLTLLTVEWSDSNRTRAYCLNRWRPSDGETEESSELTTCFFFADRDPFFAVSHLALDASDRIYLASDDEIVCLDEAFVFQFSLIPPDAVSGLCTDRDGRVYFWSNDGGGSRLTPVDADRKAFGESVALPERISAFFFGEDHDAYFAADSGVWCADGLFGDSPVTKQFLDYSTSRVYLALLCSVFDESAALFSKAEEDGRRVPVLYRRAENYGPADKTVIEIAHVGPLPMWFDQKILKYNAEHADAVIVTKDWREFAAEGDDQEAKRKLALELVTGKARPDILVGGMDDPFIEQSVKSGMFRDLGIFTENDTLVNDENIFGCVRRTLSDGEGRLWGLTREYEVRSVLSTKNLLGKYAGQTSWTLGEFLDYAGTLPPGIFLMNELSQENAARILFGSDGYGSFIDSENGTCSFASEVFVRYLEFLKSLPATVKEAVSLPENPLSGLGREEQVQFYWTGGIALKNKWFHSLNEFLSLEIEFGTKDIVLIGQPTSSGKQPITVPYVCVMTSFCENPEIAWDVIRTLIDQNDFEGGWLPVLKSDFEAKAQEYSERDFVFFFDGWETSYPKDPANPLTVDSLEKPGLIAEFTETDAAFILDYLDNRCGVPCTMSVHEDVAAIIREEISAYLGGVGSAEDCAKKIQSRVSIWLAEHR